MFKFYSNTKISRELKISKVGIGNFLKESNIKIRMNDIPKSEEHKKNLSLSRIGKYKGKDSKCYIHLTDIILEKILTLRQQGLSYHKICDEVGLKYEKVRRTIKENGL